MKLFNFIKAANFFPEFAPGVSNWRHKMRGKDGHDKPIEFSKSDVQLIRKGVKEMYRQSTDVLDLQG